MLQIQATLAIKARNKIGERPVWDAQRERLLWVDHATGIIHEARSNGVSGWREARRWDLGRSVAAAIPRRDGGLVVAAGAEILLFDEATGQSAPFASLEVDPALIRLNEA